MSIDKILEERGKNYGSFKDHAQIAQAFKRIMQGTPNWESIPRDQQESLEMIAHKVARILNGNSNYKDSWVDIAGYAQLISNNLEDPKI